MSAQWETVHIHDIEPGDFLTTLEGIRVTWLVIALRPTQNKGEYRLFALNDESKLEQAVFKWSDAIFRRLT